MASPFRFFRKRSKAMLAGLTIVAMGGFVVGPMILQRMGTGGGGENKVVIKTAKYGNLREADVAGLRRDRVKLANFVRDVGTAITANGGDSRMIYDLLRGLNESDDEAVVRAWLLAHHAEDLGVRISDEAVRRYIERLFAGQDDDDPATDFLVGRVDKPTVAKILQKNGLSEQRLVGLFQAELLANRAYSVFERSLAGVTPGQRWDCYQRLNRQVTIQTIVAPVSKYVSRVDDPGEAVLRAFFDEHKEDSHDPNSPDPGFFVPKRIRLEYFVGNREKLLADAMDTISAEEVQTHYEEHKESYKRLVLPQLNPYVSEPAGFPGLDGGLESLPGLNPGGPFSTQTEPPVVEPPRGEQDPGAADRSPPTSPEASAPDTPAPASVSPAENTPGEGDPPASPSPSPDGSESSSVSEVSPFRLTAYQEAASEAESPMVVQPPATSEPPAVIEPPATTEPPATEPVPPATEPVPSATEGDAAADPSTTIRELVDDITGETSESEYKSLEEVEEDIRRHLAALVVEDRTTSRLRGEMVAYRDDRIGRFVDDSSQQAVAAQSKIDKANYEQMVEMADELGMHARRTELLARWEVRELDIGKSALSSSNAPFAHHVFESLTEFRPEISEDDENYYVFRKVEETEPKVPKFEDVRQQVLEAYKTRKARGLALAAAEELAGEAAGTTLKEKFGARSDLAVVETQPFSWLTGGSLPVQLLQYMQLSLSRIEKKQEDPAGEEGQEDSESEQQQEVPEIAEEAVHLPGHDFMRMVFGLETNEIGVAANVPKTEYYVVQVIESNPPRADLQRQFLNDREFATRFRGISKLGIVHDYELADARNAWFAQLETEAGLEWVAGGGRGRR